MRWKIKLDEDEDGGGGWIVTAPNGCEFESYHPLDTLTPVVEGLDRRGVLAVGCDPELPADWPSLVLTPALPRPCRRCGERRPAEAYSLKPNGQIAGTCDHCCLNDPRRNAKLTPCPQCHTLRPDMRMRRGKIACPHCIAAMREVVPTKTAEFDVDAHVNEWRDKAGLPPSASKNNARTDLPRSVITDTKLL